MIRTSGDSIQDRPLAEAGGKGLFTKEIDAALLAGAIDAAVHSAKDLPSLPPEGVTIAAFLPREDPRDALVSAFADTLEGLPHGATFGAASLRRQAQALRLRPDLRPEFCAAMSRPGSRRPRAGEIGATLLALAGLKRLGLAGAPAPCSSSTSSCPRPARARSRSPRGPPMPARGKRSSRSRTPRRQRSSRRSAPSWPNSKAPAAPRSPASPGSRPGGSGSGARCCAPTAPSASRSRPRPHPATPSRLGREAGRELKSRLPEGVLVGGG